MKKSMKAKPARSPPAAMNAGTIAVSPLFKGFTILDVLTTIARSHSATVPQIALAWILANAAVTSVIVSTIAPDTWRDNGGTVGSIREFDGVLIISQTNDNHRLIEQFLAQFRATRGLRN